MTVNMRRAVGGLSMYLVLMIVAMALFVPSPVSAHAPQGAGEIAEAELENIEIYDRDGNILQISIDDVAAIHGDLCICVSGAYRATQAAIMVLYGEDELPVQGNLTVVYHHPGIGHQQVFEHILTPECVTYEKTGNPQQMTMDHWAYKFIRLDTGEIFETRINEGVIAPDFFDLRYEVNGFEKGWHENEPTEDELAEFAAAYTDSLNNLLALPTWELYSDVPEPEEPAPVGAIIFSGTLVILIVFGLIYSSRVKRL
jgi:hypothetical protein